MAGVMLDADGAVSGIKEDRAIVQLHRDDFLNSKSHNVNTERHKYCIYSFKNLSSNHFNVL
jgi:hypothetical protein